MRIDAPRGPYPNVTIICGPPLAGKTTWVNEHHQPGDLIVDWDTLATALGSPTTHIHNRDLWPYIGAARNAVLNQLRRDPTRRAWIITTDPTVISQWPRCRYKQLTITPDEAHKRADQAGRPDGTHEAIDAYFRNWPPPSKT